MTKKKSNKKIKGIHHITAICGDPQANADFYMGVLGLRLVKQTVNFDAPTSYHLYYGDHGGDPGTVITFFPWPDMPQGVHGTGQVTAVSFSVAKESFEYWKKRFDKYEVSYEEPHKRMGERVLPFKDPNGLALELVEQENPPDISLWEGSEIPPEFSLCGFNGVTLAEEGFEATAHLLEDVFGFSLEEKKGDRTRFVAPTKGLANRVDVVCHPNMSLGYAGLGTVHHVAFCTSTKKSQKEWRKKITEEGLNVTPVIDRYYFTSIYFREPGGILFELATEGPGFDKDEEMARLGRKLQLPPWLEERREELLEELPPFHYPDIEEEL